MKKLVFVFAAIFGTAVYSAEDRVLARFEVVAASSFAAPPNKRQVVFFQRGKDVLVAGIADVPRPVSIGPLASARLMATLARLNLPKLDYQAYFDRLLSAQPKANTGPARKGRAWGVLDGHETEIEIHAAGAKVRFRMTNPEAFFFGYDDDKVVAEVSAAVDAFVLAVSSGRLFL